MPSNHYPKYLRVIFFSIALFLSFNFVSAESVKYVHTDHIGSTSVVTNENGELISNNTYYPYGNTNQERGTSPTERKYTGQISDQDQTNLYYYNARYYNPMVSKFTQADIVKDGQNRYAYVSNNPIKYIDPSGNKKLLDGERRIKNNVKYDVKESENYVDSIDDATRLHIAVGVWSETNNGGSPDFIQRMIAMILFNRAKTPYASIYVGGIGVAITELGFQDQTDGYSTEENVNYILDNCLLNSEQCSEQSRFFEKSLNYTEGAYQEWLGDESFDRSITNFIVINDLTSRTFQNNQGQEKTITFRDSDHYSYWLYLNLEYHKQQNPDFVYYFVPFMKGYNNTKGTEVPGKDAILLTGNDPCIYTNVCGWSRPGFASPHLIPESSYISSPDGMGSRGSKYLR